jgi:hypothetical protein
VRGRGVCALAALLAVVCFGASSCSPGDDDAGDGSDAGGGAHADSGGRADETTTTVPPDEPTAAEPNDVVPYLEDLLAGYDAAVNEIVTDPSVAEDPGSPVIEELMALFEPGSTFATGSVDGWAAQSDEGTALAPTSADQDINTTVLEGPPTRIDDDTVMFGHCTVQSYVVVRDGDEERRAERVLLPGNGRAVRIDGHWLLQEITTPPDTQGCLTQGGVGGGSG